ncbi:MAG: hypothetical protein JSW66_06055 [Phycisphaerales bacterium]|nr:MAG: hypothetical protein JSW66_06055 [Phycisphaerales bacterium]
MVINRRAFISNAALATFFGLSNSSPGKSSQQTTHSVQCRVRALTSGPKHHFFGYYGICPWNQSGRRLVCLESGFQDRMPSEGEAAAVGLVDAETGQFHKVAETRAWNLQQGAMLHWNPLSPEDQIIYNDRQGEDIASVVLNANSGRKRLLPRAVSAVSHNGKWALSLTYGRVGRLRKVVGYGGAQDPNPDDPAPENDGVFLMDLTSGESKLVVSIAQVYERLVGKHPRLKGCHMWFNHTVFSKSDTRFFFLARANLPPDQKRQTGMFTANLDGSQLREAIPFDKSVSHFDWRDDRQIIATCSLDGSGRKHVLFTDGQADYRVIGEGFLDFDGHCSFSPDRDWIATDRKRGDTRRQWLLIYNVRTGQRQVLYSGDMQKRLYMSGDMRCDFHPRWSREGDKICFDAIEPGGTRQLHVAYLSGL